MHKIYGFFVLFCFLLFCCFFCCCCCLILKTGTQKIIVVHIIAIKKLNNVWFHNAVKHPKIADGMANSVDPDQIAP